MSEFDPTTIQLLTNQNDLQSLFDPNYKITTYETDSADTHSNSIYHGTNSNNGSRRSSMQQHINFHGTITPNTHQFYQSPTLPNINYSNSPFTNNNIDTMIPQQTPTMTNHSSMNTVNIIDDQDDDNYSLPTMP